MPRLFVLVLLSILTILRVAHADYGAGVRAWGQGDYPVAAAEFRSAADAGDPESQYMLGRLYSLGDGVPRDFVQAWLWFDRAARQGHQGAAEARAGMEGVLNSSQLALARQLAMPPSPPSPSSPPSLAAPPPQVAGVPAPAARSVVLVPRRAPVEFDPADQQQAAR